MLAAGHFFASAAASQGCGRLMVQPLVAPLPTEFWPPASPYTDQMSLLNRAAAPPSNAQLVAMLDRSDDAVVLFDARARVAFANRSARALLGAEPGQTAQAALQALDPAGREPLLQALAGTEAEVERNFSLPDGVRWRCRLSSVPPAGRLLSLQQRYAGPTPPTTGAAAPKPMAPTSEPEFGLEFGPEFAHAAADEPPSDPALWFDLSPVAMVVYQRDGHVLRSNPALAALVGPVPQCLRDAPPELCQVLGWDGHVQQPSLWPEAGLDQAARELRSTLTLADGRRLRLCGRLRPLGQGAQAQVLAVVEDRSLEDDHELAQLEIGALMDTAGVGVATFELSRGWHLSRPSRSSAPAAAVDPGFGLPVEVAGGAAVGSAAGAAVGADVRAAVGEGGGPAGLHPSLQSIRREQVEPSSLADYERLQRALRSGQRAQVRYAVRVPGLGLRWLLTRVEPGELAGGRPALSVVTLDLTEREAAKRRNEQLLRELSTILDGTSAGMAYLRGERLLRCNRRFETLLGLASGCADSPVAQALAEQPAVLDGLRRAMAGPENVEMELEPQSLLAGQPGQSPWLSLSATRVVVDGQVEVVAVLTDVSHLKAQQAEMEALARERELMFSLSEVGIAHVREGRILRANQALARLTGYAVEALQDMPLSVLFESPSQFVELRDQLDAALAQSGRFSGERRLRRHDGQVGWVQVTKRQVDESHPEAGLICSYVDIDERRQVREALQLQAERTRAILDSVLVGIVTVGDTGIEWMNRSARRMFGGELADFVGQPIAIVAPDEPGHPLRATHYRDSLGDGQAETFECRLRGRDGREFWVVGNAVVTGRESAEAGGSQITFALLDIERRRQAEISIAQAQASLQRIIETAPLAIALFDAASGTLLRLNHMAATYFGAPEERLLQRPPEDWFSREDAQALRLDFAQARARSDGLRREVNRPAPEQGMPARVWDVRIVSLDAGGQAQVLLVGSDVTEQRLAEQERFEAAVSQRELLIKEVHHRIKNNLQGVAGLLQQTAARRPEVAQLISEAVGQVHAIAQVHGLQVGLSGPLQIEPLLQAITASVQRTFGRTITLRLSGAPARRYALPEAESIPIALTINELLTNAIKHSLTGDIDCQLHCSDAGVTVTIRNLGRLADDFNLAQVAPGVSGLGLVRALLPRRTATLGLSQEGAMVQACVALVAPGFTLLAP